MEHKTQRTMAKKVFRILFMLLIAVFGIYLAIQFIIIFHRGYKTETAIAYTMADSISLQGVVSFDTVRVDGSGDLGYLVSDGERVTNGTVLAECYTDDSQGLLRERLDRLGRTIDLLSKSQNSSGSDLSLLTSQTRQALYNLLDKLDTAQYSGITDAEDAFLLAQNRMQVNTGQTEGFTQTIQVLQTEYDGIKAQLDTLQTITAATNGYFSSVSASPTIVTDAAQLDAATPAELNELLQNGFPAADRHRLQLEVLRCLRPGHGGSAGRHFQCEDQCARQAEYPAVCRRAGIDPGRGHRPCQAGGLLPDRQCRNFELWRRDRADRPQDLRGHPHRQSGAPHRGRTARRLCQVWQPAAVLEDRNFVRGRELHPDPR